MIFWNYFLIRVCRLHSFSSPSAGKNVKRSIHGMGQMMSTMVLNRKQSMFGGTGARGAGLGLDGHRGGKDSIDKMDLTVMDTKLKILEILQVTNRTGELYGMNTVLVGNRMFVHLFVHS